MAVITGVRPSRPNGKSEAWEAIVAQHDQIKEWLDQGLTLTTVHALRGRRGVVVSYRTLHRCATTELGFGPRRMTVRVADCEPGSELWPDPDWLINSSCSGEHAVTLLAIGTGLRRTAPQPTIEPRSELIDEAARHLVDGSLDGCSEIACER